jgi:DNA adenine methylase
MTAAEVTDSGPKITALAPWFGGKRNLSAAIVEELGEHRVYWEPFCGSMAVLLSMPPCVMETANDLHGDLTNLARVIKDACEGPRLYRRLRRMLMAEELFEDSAEIIREDDPIDGAIDPERAFHYFVVSWLGRNGVAGTGSYNAHFCVRYTANGGHAAKRWESAIESIPQWHKRLRNVTILRRDAFEIIPRIDDKAGTAIYVDPPYIEKGSTYLHDFGMSSKRGQDKSSALQAHRDLAALLRRFKKTRVVVSYYEHPMLSELYPGWSCRRIEVSKALAHQGRRGENDTKAMEVLLINGQSNAADVRNGLFT